MKRAPLLLLVAACGSTPDRFAPPTAWSLTVPRDVTRTWVGPDVWANRLQDWRIANGRVECVVGAERAPLRTLMLTTHDVRPGGPETLVLEVVTAPRGAPRGEAFAGFLVGAGGPEVDPLISAQVHHRPAEDGGILAVVDAAGVVAFHDNASGDGGGGQWSIAGPLAEGELVPLPAERNVLVARAPSDEPVRLVLEVDSTRPRGCALTLSAYSTTDGTLLSSARTEAPASAVDGLVGLVSHRADDAEAPGHWFEAWRASGDGLVRHVGRGIGPLVGVQYTRSRGVLKLTAQCMPLEGRGLRGTLSLRTPGGAWREVSRGVVLADSWTLPFRVEGVDPSRAHEFRVALRVDGRDFELLGELAREPSPDEEVVVASMNCTKHYVGNLKWNGRALWFPHVETAAHVASLEPDLLFFAGDQAYEGDLDPVDARDDGELILDYLYKWYRFLLSFGELTRRIPTITVPDDHDVYHGNLWGAGGRLAVADPERGLSAQDAGGYKHSARFVNVVHATQSSHLPDPVDPAPIERGITVYFTRLVLAGVDFAILSDRMFKDSASDVLAGGEVRNGWFRDPDFDPRESDVPSAQLLGPRQEAFLARWARDWPDDVRAKVVLSQTPFVNVATIPEEAGGGEVLPSLPVPEPGEYPEGYRFAADTDSGGWPQSARDRALHEVRRCLAVHLAGDQHLGTLVQYGIDAPRDAGFAFTSPAIANTWPRRWWPPVHGARAEPGAPHYTGDFVDGFGNPLTVWAAANPVRSGREPAALYDRAPGYGIVRFAPGRDAITFECWPRWVDPLAPDAWQYAGWPRTITRLENGLAEPAGTLPAVDLGADGAVIELWREVADGEDMLVYVLRVDGPEFAAPVPDAAATYRLRVVPPGGGEAREHGVLSVAGPR